MLAHLTRRDTPCYSASLLAKKPDLKRARSVRQRREFEEMAHQPAQAGTLVLDIASARDGAGARPIHDFGAQLGARTAIVWASISNEDAPNVEH